MDACMMRRFGLVVGLLVIVGFGVCSAETIAHTKRDLVSAGCSDCGSADEISVRGRVLNLIPRNQFGQPAFTLGPTTFGVEAGVLDGLGGWMAVIATAPLAIFMLWGAPMFHMESFSHGSKKFF
ncbi:hypothetical protein BSKO_09641 [Bryopsis sp. KO-2023]|nr:hypothetical protein BSKO_09641 [Bryopsis sp. KO-2023]